MANNLDDEAERLSRVLANLSDNLSNKTSTDTAANAAQASYNEEIKKAKAAQAAYNKTVESAVDGLKKMASQAHNAALSSEQSMSKYSGAISSAGSALGQFAGQFGPWGKALELGIHAFTAVTDAVLKQNDAILKSYDGLSQLGATANLSTDEILQLGMKAGYSSKNLEGLYKSAKSLEGGLIALGGSSSAGVKAFADIANIGDEARANFRMLGFSQEEVTEMQADYVKQVAKVGGTLAKTPKELSEESQRYITNLSALSELTGKTVKEQQQAREKAMAQANVNAFINNLERKRADAMERGDKIEGERLQKQIESTQAYAGHIVATEDAASATAKLQSLTTDGAVVLGKNNAMMAGMGYNFNKVNEALRRGESPMKLMFLNAEQNANVNKRATQMYGENLYRLGDTSIGLQKLAGQTNEQRENQAKYDKYLKLSAEEKAKVDKMTMEEQLAYLSEKKKSDDSTLAADAERQKAEREYKQAMDGLVRLFSGLVNPMMTFFYKVLTMVATAIKGLVDIVQTIGEGFTNLSDMFDDFIDGMRENTLMQKMFGLKGLTDAEKHAKEMRDKEKEAKHIARKEALYGRTEGGAPAPAAMGVAAPAGAPSSGAFDMTKYLKATALVESGGNTNAKAGTSSAGGLFQFIDSTWTSMVKKMGKNYSLQDKFDPKKSAEVMAFFTNQQKAQLEKATGKSASSTDMYMAHFLGAGGAGKFINQMSKDPNAIAADLDPKAAAANKSIYYDEKGKPRTVQEVYSLMAKKVGKAESAVETGKWGKGAVPDAVATLTGPMSSGGSSSVPAPSAENIKPAPQAQSSMPAQNKAVDDAVYAQAKAAQATGSESTALVEVMDKKLSQLIEVVQQGNNTSSKMLKLAR